MHNERGQYNSISASRRIIMDLMHEARQVPSIPVQRWVQLGDLETIRQQASPRISWFILFMKAFALVAREHPQLRRSLIRYPWGRFYDHPFSICSLAIERHYQGEPCLFFAHFRSPETQTLTELQDALTRYKAKPIDSVGYYRRALMIGRLPTPVRRMLWWMSLNFSGLKRAKRMGTFGITSYGVLGAESLHPISPLTCTFNFGPIGKDGTVLIKIIYDHRTLDGSEVARRLRDIETALLTQVRAELLAMSVVEPETDGADNTQNRQIRQDAMHQAQKPNLGMERAAQTDETRV